jgi:hypothetical protein
MLISEEFIVQEGNVFYFDLEEYNSKSDIIVDEGDTVKFMYEGVKYIGKIASIGSKKNQSFVLNVVIFP